MDNINLEYNAVIIKEKEGGYSSLCLDLDVASQGETIEEAKKMLIEAVNGYLEVCIEHNVPFLRPIPDEDNPVINEPETIVERFKIKSELKIHTHA